MKHFFLIWGKIPDIWKNPWRFSSLNNVFKAKLLTPPNFSSFFLVQRQSFSTWTTNPPTHFNLPLKRINFTFRYFFIIYWPDSIFARASLLNHYCKPKNKMAFSIFIYLTWKFPVHDIRNPSTNPKKYSSKAKYIFQAISAQFEIRHYAMKPEQKII